MIKPSWKPMEKLSSYKQNNSWTHSLNSPTHICVLGDLFSSQWIDNEEFKIRLARYQSIFRDPATHSIYSTTTHPNNDIPILINVTGNHDIGYGYDISQARLDRWEQVFGKSNFVSSIVIPSSEDLKDSQSPRKLHFVVLNTMLLDGPSSDENLRGQTWQFLQDAAELKTKNPEDKIVILTHIPFHKEQGICVDTPDIHVHWDNTIIEQTMLTPNTTTWILENLKPDFVLNGHDHFGCDVVHIRSSDQESGQDSWVAHSTSEFLDEKINQQGLVSVREVTQRSMMAEFGGYSGLFEIRVTEENPDKIEFHYSACGFYKDLYVWIVIVTAIIAVVVWVLIGLYRIQASILPKSQIQTREKKLKKL
ncbi:hypothetical protein BGZ46_004246 [Entomortierella lignicola]|nr:hypothetical protein BGZ46_004246 [Entomortierella lignicola]